MESVLVLGLLPLLIAFAAASDLLTMTISNRLCLAIGLLFPPVAWFLGMPAVDILLHAAAGLIVLTATFGMFAAGWIGGGDAKFTAATAMWLGFGALVPFLALSAVFGGLLTLALLWIKANQIPALAIRMPWFAQLQDRETGIPYGIALSAAALLVIPQTGIWRLAWAG